MSEECTAHPDFKKALMEARARQAISRPQHDSKPPVVAVRAIKNKGAEDFGKLQLRLLRELEEGKIGREKAQYEVENFWMGALRRAVIEGDIEHGSLMAGQSVGLIHECCLADEGYYWKPHQRSRRRIDKNSGDIERYRHLTRA